MGTPGLPHPPALENKVFDAPSAERSARGQPGRPSTDDDTVGHRFPSLCLVFIIDSHDLCIAGPIEVLSARVMQSGGAGKAKI